MCFMYVQTGSIFIYVGNAFDGRGLRMPPMVGLNDEGHIIQQALSKSKLILGELKGWQEIPKG